MKHDENQTRKTVDDYLRQIPLKPAQESSTNAVVAQQKAAPDGHFSPVLNVPTLPTQGGILGFVTRLRETKLRTAKQLEALDVVLSAQVGRLRNEATAALRENETFSKARTAQVCAGHIAWGSHELERIALQIQQQKAGTLSALSVETDREIQHLVDSNIAESLKERAIADVIHLYQITREQITSNELAKKYGLM